MESINPYLQYIFKQMGYDKYSQPKVPFIIFVKIDGKAIVDNFAVELSYNNRINVNESDACNELLRIIRNITLQLQNIKIEDNPDKDTIFNLVKIATQEPKVFNFLIFVGKKIIDFLL